MLHIWFGLEIFLKGQNLEMGENPLETCIRSYEYGTYPRPIC